MNDAETSGVEASQSDLAYWAANRSKIIDAIEQAGFQLISNTKGFRLVPCLANKELPAVWVDPVQLRLMLEGKREWSMVWDDQSKVSREERGPKPVRLHFADDQTHE